MKTQFLLLSMAFSHFLATNVLAAHKPAAVHDIRQQKPPVLPPKAVAAHGGILVARAQADKPGKDKEPKKQGKQERKEAKEQQKEERKEQLHAKKEEVKVHPPVVAHVQKLVDEKKLHEQRHLTGWAFPSFASFPKIGGFGSVGATKAWSINDQNMGTANTMTTGKGKSNLSLNNEGTSASAKGENQSLAGGNFMNMHNSWSKDLMAQSAFPAAAASGTAGLGFPTSSFGQNNQQAAFPGFAMKSAWMKTAQTMADSKSMASGNGSAEIKAGKTGVTAVAEGTEGTANQGNFANQLDAWSDEGASHLAPADDKKAAVEYPINFLIPVGTVQDVAVVPPTQQVVLTAPQTAEPQIAAPQQAQTAAPPQAAIQQVEQQIPPQAAIQQAQQQGQQ